jgi:hypothetical protein
MGLLRVLAALLAATASNGTVHDASAQSKVDGAGIVRGAGRVKAEGAHLWRDTTTADLLAAGTTIQASDVQPLEMILPDGVTVTLEPGALAGWMPAAKLPSETNRWTRGYHLVLQEGELEVRMPPGQKGAHAFLVSTKAGTLTEWRGQLHVKVQRDATAAAIYEGALVVGSNGQGFPVYDGAGILMRRGVNPDKTRAIPAPPQWIPTDSPFTIVVGSKDPRLDLAWRPVAHADAYRVEVATDPTMVRVVERATVTQPHYLATKLASTERYWAHVRAVADVGIIGSWSAPCPVRVLHFELPAGGFVANDGTIVLPDGASVALLGTERLDVAFENVITLARRVAVPLYWSRLSGPLRLGDETPMRIIHLRDPDIANSGEARLVLARRELRARVALSPARARWPLDPIQARIDVDDPSGRIDAANAGVSVEAMLNLTPLAVRWERSGNTWTARIAPRLIADPSVLRVVVRDGGGSEIGRGFLELEPMGAGKESDQNDIRATEDARRSASLRQ